MTSSRPKDSFSKSNVTATLLTGQISITVSHIASIPFIQFISVALQEKWRITSQFPGAAPEFGERRVRHRAQEERGGENYAKEQRRNQQMESWENTDIRAIQRLCALERGLFHTEQHGSHKRAGFLRENQGSLTGIPALSLELQNLG